MKGERVALCRWAERHHAPFAALNADPEVMRLLVSPLSRAQSDALIARFEAHHAREGYGVWALESLTGELLGAVGLSKVNFEAPFSSLTAPAHELSWRLKHSAWGHGYATEAARLNARFAFEELGLDEVVAFTVPHNHASRAVMRRLGMREVGRFAHPRLPPHHSLSEHVLYRLQVDWLKPSHPL
jgi:ribosomal-protein-alanine N-acetyltransferase